MVRIIEHTPGELALLKADILRGYKRRAPGFYLGSAVPGCQESPAPFRENNGVSLNERAKIELTTSHFETPIYERAVRKALTDLPPGPLLELGAGDGRITRMLLAYWPGTVLACDCNLPALERLHAALPQKLRQRLVLLCTDTEELALNLSQSNFSAIVAVETLYYLGAGFEAALARLAKALAPAGRLVHAEPTVESWLLHTLNLGEWEGALAAAEHGAVEARYRGFTPEEMQHIYAGCGLRLLDTDSTPLANLLLITRLVRSGLSQKQQIEIARRIRATLTADSLPRCIIYTATAADDREGSG